jgi:starch-binding outer membrane protein, SusD/RagB family
MTACLLVSCTDFLDVKPKSQVEQEVLFNTQEGFMEALLGVYLNNVTQALYGYELMATPDVLAQNYYAPANTDAKEEYQYLQTKNFAYQHQYFRSRRDKIWGGLYNGIANANIILERIDDKKTIFQNEGDFYIIKGEALALRAYLHFDLYRLFAPSYLNNPGAPAIPYVTTFSSNVTTQSTGAEVVDKVIADLLEAKKLLADWDPIVSASYVIGYPNKDVDAAQTETTGRVFLQNRRHRLNYYAVCGALARVYLYKNDKVAAMENAKIVIDAHKFSWTAKEAFNNSDVQLRDRVAYKEVLFGWDIARRADDLYLHFFENATTLNTLVDDGTVIFETGGVGALDFRFKQWLKQSTTSGYTALFLQKYLRDRDKNLHPLIAPAIRLSELYYILAECTFDSDPEAAWGYFNEVRFNRGIGTEIHGETSKEVFLSEMLKEYRKEFFGEGQVFYAYKRLNRDIIGTQQISIPATNEIFVLPMPDDEIAFGQRN